MISNKEIEEDHAWRAMTFSPQPVCKSLLPSYVRSLVWAVIDICRTYMQSHYRFLPFFTDVQ